MLNNIKIKKLDSSETNPAFELISLFGFDDENDSIPPADYTKELLARDDFHVIVALDNEKIVGGLTAYEMKMFKCRETEMLLYGIEVEDAYRRNGIASALIENLKQICREKGISQMYVGTEKDNLPARGLYNSTGGTDDNSVWFNYSFT